MIQEKWLLIGHRGSGKSSFLRGLSQYFEHCIDLDEEIEKRGKKAISAIFDEFGEEAFRQLEAATLDKILKENEGKTSVVIALGAGFEARIWPLDYKCLWLRKETDVWPRFYSDRPAVGTSDPLNFLSNYIKREQRYQQLAHVAWTFEEGYEALPKRSCQWPLDYQCDESACLTLVPRLHKDPIEAIELRTNWKIRFELRSDLWSAEVIKKVLAQNTDSKFLVSVRTEKFSVEDVLPANREKILVDWDLSFGEVPSVQPDIISLHDFSSGLKVGLNKLDRYLETYPGLILKAAPFVNTFEDLIQLWKWKGEDVSRMIYPRTPMAAENAKWQWVRLLLKDKQSVNFVREATEGPKDQPTISQFLRHVPGKFFAAILGDPVFHSYSPNYHHDFFEKKQMPFLCIPASKEDFSLLFFDFLDSLGAKAFAITTPLKEQGTFAAKSSAGEGEAEETWNTLVKKAEWKRYNTDIQAATALWKKSSQAWRIWGAGAVAKQCFEVMENAELYSTRSGERVAAKGSVEEGAFNVLWAAGDEAKDPPDHWKPLIVHDLSYTQRSHAILYANKHKVDYVSGLEFFKIQAEAQQKLWNDL